LEDSEAQAEEEVAKSKALNIKMPFVFVRAGSNNKYGIDMKYDATTFQWKVQEPFNLYGDTDVLEMMGMGELKSDDDIK
jgi:hypothetical protein